MPPSVTLLAGPIGRIGFGPLLASRRLIGKAVEVGTHRGLFAHSLLSNWWGRLWCVDHWQSGYDQGDPASYGDRAADQRAAESLLSVFGDRAVIMVASSPEAAASFDNGSLDFVYIDGCHQENAVLADLKGWWPKIHAAGILAGHDYICPGEVNGGWGRTVQPAVNRFAQEVGVGIYLVPEIDSSSWSYYLEKK